MPFDFKEALGKFAGGFAGGIGEGIGKVAGKISDWVPTPQQYRRNKIRELTNEMFRIQSARPFDFVKYDLIRKNRDKLEQDSANA